MAFQNVNLTGGAWGFHWSFHVDSGFLAYGCCSFSLDAWERDVERIVADNSPTRAAYDGWWVARLDGMIAACRALALGSYDPVSPTFLGRWWVNSVRSPRNSGVIVHVNRAADGRVAAYLPERSPKAAPMAPESEPTETERREAFVEGVATVFDALAEAWKAGDFGWESSVFNPHACPSFLRPTAEACRRATPKPPTVEELAERVERLEAALAALADCLST